MTRLESLAGVVLAGGYADRFGDGDKALASVRGTPMIRRVVDRLLEVTDEVVVACRNEQVTAIAPVLETIDAEVQFATDPTPDRGPLVGIRGGLHTTDREFGAVVACDMPFVDPTLLRLLYRRAADCDAAVVELENGWVQPMGAVYRADPTAEACAKTLERGERRTSAILDELDWHPVKNSELAGVDPATFFSVDTPEALRDAEKRLERRASGSDHTAP